MTTRLAANSLMTSTGQAALNAIGTRKRSIGALSALALVGAFLGSASNAGAADFQISALGLDTLTGNRGVELHGMLSQASGDFFTGLPSLPDASHVCGFSATFRDNDATHDLTATLERRNAAPGGSVDQMPQVMAKVKSQNATATIRRRSTEAIANRIIDTQGFAYFVRVSLPPGNTIQLVKLDLDLRIAC